MTPLPQDERHRASPARCGHAFTRAVSVSPIRQTARATPRASLTKAVKRRRLPCRSGKASAAPLPLWPMKLRGVGRALPQRYGLNREPRRLGSLRRQA